MAMDSVLIRKSKRDDCMGIIDLINELAEFQKMPKEAELTAADLQRDGFDIEHPLFRCIVAEQDGRIIGMALYFFSYSTWKGKTLHLEDFVVTEKSRNLKVGEKIYKAVAQEALDENCYRMDFEVLAWNPARRFYDRKDAINVSETEPWLKYRVNRPTIDAIANSDC